MVFFSPEYVTLYRRGSCRVIPSPTLCKVAGGLSSEMPSSDGVGVSLMHLQPGSDVSNVTTTTNRRKPAENQAAPQRLHSSNNDEMAAIGSSSQGTASVKESNRRVRKLKSFTLFMERLFIGVPVTDVRMICAYVNEANGVDVLVIHIKASLARRIRAATKRSKEEFDPDSVAESVRYIVLFPDSTNVDLYTNLLPTIPLMQSHGTTLSFKSIDTFDSESFINMTNSTEFLGEVALDATIVLEGLCGEEEDEDGDGEYLCRSPLPPLPVFSGSSISPLSCQPFVTVTADDPGAAEEDDVEVVELSAAVESVPPTETSIAAAPAAAPVPEPAASVPRMAAERLKIKAQKCRIDRSLETGIQDELKKCVCNTRYHISKIEEGKYLFGEPQKVKLVRILHSTVLVRVGGGWVGLEEFLVKNDPCRVKKKTKVEGFTAPQTNPRRVNHHQIPPPPIPPAARTKPRPQQGKAAASLLQQKPTASKSSRALPAV